MTEYTPHPDHQFVFGLWTVGDPGRDTWGGATRDRSRPDEIVRRLGEIGAAGVCFHDNDLIPFDATPSEREEICAGSARRSTRPGCG